MECTVILVRYICISNSYQYHAMDYFGVNYSISTDGMVRVINWLCRDGFGNGGGNGGADSKYSNEILLSRQLTLGQRGRNLVRSCSQVPAFNSTFLVTF